MYKKLSQELFKYLLSAFFIWCFIILIRQQSGISVAIKSATLRCLNIIIPSLFSFMVLSSVVISSRIYSYISKPFYPITRFILAIPNQLFFVFLMGNISGYPIGAKLILELLEQKKITKKTAEILICSCYGGGPAFFTGAVGLAIYGDAKIGIIIFISTISSNLITAMIVNRIYKIRFATENENITLNADILTNSIVSAGKSMFIICIALIFFSVIVAVIEGAGFFDFLLKIGVTENQCTLIKSILEISNLSELKNSGIGILPHITAICSFGGICVLMQIKSIVGKAYSLKYFLITRVFIAIFSGFICKIILHFIIPKTIYTVSKIPQPMTISNNIIPSLCLIGMIMIVYLSKKRLSVLHEQS